jgi:cytosine/adenosine deaminase-related metal-dependent hydrolase
MLENLKNRIIDNGGFVNAHAHFDRAFTLEMFSEMETYKHLEEKWKLVDRFKAQACANSYEENVLRAIDSQINFGVSHACSFIDVDSLCQHAAIVGAKKAAAARPNFKIKLACQTLKGVLRPAENELLETVLDSFDIIGSLPRADGIENIERHLDKVMFWAKARNKRLHVHVDQLNCQSEKETELLARKTIEWGLEGTVTAVHGISLACHEKYYRQEVYKICKDAGLSFVTCPSAWIDHVRREDLAPIHNAITPVDELLEHDIVVALGSDNIHDVYKPYADGDMMFELRLLLEACKIYDEDALVKIATENGKKVLGIDN